MTFNQRARLKDNIPCVSVPSRGLGHMTPDKAYQIIKWAVLGFPSPRGD